MTRSSGIGRSIIGDERGEGSFTHTFVFFCNKLLLQPWHINLQIKPPPPPLSIFQYHCKEVCPNDDVLALYFGNLVYCTLIYDYLKTYENSIQLLFTPV